MKRSVMGVDIKDTGELKEKSAFSLIYQAICDHYDGVFVFASGKEKYSLILQNQKLKTPTSIVDEATLGKYLFEKNILNDETFMQVKKTQESQKAPFFQAAIQSGLVSFDQIQSFVQMRMDAVLATIFSWNVGKYIVVGQIPKDIVQIEVQEGLFPYIFFQRLQFHLGQKVVVPDRPFDFVNHPSLSMDILSLTPAQVKILQTLKKTRTVKNTSQFVGVEDIEVHAFVRTLLDFQILAFEKPNRKSDTKKSHYIGFDFAHVYENFEKLSFYELLGLPTNVQVSEVPAQYFDIAKHYHPDRFKHSESFAKEKVEKVFGRITEAYQTLSNATLKQAYDNKVSGKDEKDQLDVEKVIQSEGLFLDGMDFLRRGQFEKASAAFQKAIVLYDEEYEYFIRLGWSQYRLGLKTNAPELVKEGKTAIAKALKQDRAKDDVWYYQGLIFKHDGEFEKAKTSFQHCLEENKNHLQAGQELRAVIMLLEKRVKNKKGWFK